MTRDRGEACSAGSAATRTRSSPRWTTSPTRSGSARRSAGCESTPKPSTSTPRWPPLPALPRHVDARPLAAPDLQVAERHPVAHQVAHQTVGIRGLQPVAVAVAIDRATPGSRAAGGCHAGSPGRAPPSRGPLLRLLGDQLRLLTISCRARVRHAYAAWTRETGTMPGPDREQRPARGLALAIVALAATVGSVEDLLGALRDTDPLPAGVPHADARRRTARGDHADRQPLVARHGGDGAVIWSNRGARADGAARVRIISPMQPAGTWPRSSRSAGAAGSPVPGCCSLPRATRPSSWNGVGQLSARRAVEYVPGSRRHQSLR